MIGTRLQGFVHGPARVGRPEGWPGLQELSWSDLWGGF